MADEPEDPPLPPDGYAEPYRLDYPTILLFLGSFLLGLISLVGFGGLLVTLQGPEIFEALGEVEPVEDGVMVSHDLTVIAVPVLASLIITVIVHELLHGLAFKRKGYSIEYGFILRKGAFFTAALGQFQRREDLFPVAFAPLIVMSIAFLPLLAVPHPLVAITAFFILIVNTSGAIGDLYLAWRLYRMPSGTLFYDVTIERMYVYEPAKD